MSVPVVPSKTADGIKDDADTQLTWPPEDTRFALDVMDLQTRRVMTTDDAAKDICLLDEEPGASSRDAAARPIAVVASMPARRTAVERTADADRHEGVTPRSGSPSGESRLTVPVLLRAAAVVILVQAIVIGIFLAQGRSSREPAAATASSDKATRALAAAAPSVAVALPAGPARQPAAPRPIETRGRLLVRSDPPGAVVVVDGQRRGTTPFTVEELTAGGHRVQLGSGSVSIEQTITIEAGTTTTLVVPMPSAAATATTGWLNVAAPIEIQVLENGRLAGTSAEGPLRLAAGTHKLHLVNEALGYHGQETVAIRGGEMMRLRPALPDGLLHVNAQPWANVWVDGQRIGETPLANVKVPLGQHEIRFRHPSLGEQVRQVVVSAAEPARVSVNMKP
jgi:PEGA domain-containing protein